MSHQAISEREDCRITHSTDRYWAPNTCLLLVIENKIGHVFVFRSFKRCVCVCGWTGKQEMKSIELATMQSLTVVGKGGQHFGESFLSKQIS